MDGLSKTERKEQGLENGVTKLTFVASFVLLEGMSLMDFNAQVGQTGPAPWLKVLDVSNRERNHLHACANSLTGWKLVGGRCISEHVP